MAKNSCGVLALVGIAALVSNCSATDDTTSATAQPIISSLSVPRPLGNVEAQAGLDTVPGMYDAAEFVVVGTQVGDVKSFRYGERDYPVVAIQVSQYLKGEGTTTVDVLQSLTTLDDLGVEVPLVSGPGNFLLFLTKASADGKAVRDGLYTPVTEVMGAYFESEPGSGQFLPLDDTNPLLPDTLSAASLEQIVAESG